MYVDFYAGEHGNFTLYLAVFQDGNPLQSYFGIRHVFSLIYLADYQKITNANNGGFIIYMSTDREKERLDWHSGFDGGLNLSFMKYKKYNIIGFKHPNDELNIDVL